MSNFLNNNFDFWGHLPTFRAENIPKSRPFKVKNNSQKLPKQLQKLFEKVQKTTFSIPKIAKTRVSTWQNISLTTPKQVKKSLEITFSIPKIAKIDLSNVKIGSSFDRKSKFSGSYIDVWS